MDLKDFRDELSEKATSMGFSDWEIAVEQGESFEIHIFKGDIAQYKNAYPLGLAFRGTYKGKMGYASTEKIDNAIIDELLKNAVDNAEMVEDTDVETLYKGDGDYPTVDTYNEKLNDVSVAWKIQLGKDLEQYAFGLDARVVSVDHCVVGSGEGGRHMMNSYGLDLTHKSNMAYAYVYVRVKEDGQTKVAGEIWFGNDFDQCNSKELARKAVEKAVSYLNASKVASKKYAVVFDNLTACDLFAVYASIFFAENVQKGLSLLKNKQNEAIASSVVTLRDDGVYEQSLGSVPFDSEGVATKNKTLVENGVLKTYLYNLKAAAKDGTAPTGNGFKQTLGGTIGTSCTNFYMVPGAESKEQMIKRMGTGLLITELSGLHAGTNTISGDFSLSADGFYIENGKIVKAVEQITVSGNFYDMLKRIVGVGNDLHFDLPVSHGTIGMPSIFVDEIEISGK